MLKIYHVPGTRSMRPVWLCHELDLPVQIQVIDFSATYRDSAEWRAISPAGKVPALTDEDLTMFESGAMVEYILERYGNGRLCPDPGTSESAIHHQWCWFSEATLIRPMGLNRLLRHKADGDEPIASDAREKLNDCLRVVDHSVEDRAFLLGADFTAADIMMGYSLHLIANLNLLDPAYESAISYLDRLRSREAFMKTALLS